MAGKVGRPRKQKYEKRVTSLPMFIRRIRRNAALTPAVLAKRIGISEIVMKLIEQGEKIPRLQRIPDILAACQAHELLFAGICVMLAGSPSLREPNFFCYKPELKALLLFKRLRYMLEEGMLPEEKWGSYLAQIEKHVELFGGVLGIDPDEALRIYRLVMANDDPEDAENRIVAGVFALDLERWFMGIHGSKDLNFDEIFNGRRTGETE